MYFDHCARRSIVGPVATQQELPTGERPMHFRPLGFSSGGGATPVSFAIPYAFRLRTLPPSSLSRLQPAPLLQAGPQGPARVVGAIVQVVVDAVIGVHLLLLLHDREGTITVVRLQLTFPPCAGTAGKAFSPGGYLMSIWGWD